MHYVILVSQAGQQTYDDSERHYTYPARYNAALAPLMAGEPTVVILYESRRAGSGRGLQAYIGWTVVQKFSGQQIFKGVVLGSGPVAELFPEIWKSEQYLAALREVTPEQMAERTVLEDQLMADVETKFPGFFAEYKTEMTSGDPYRVQRIVREAGEKMKVVLADRGINVNAAVAEVENDNSLHGTCVWAVVTAAGAFHVVALYVNFFAAVNVYVGAAAWDRWIQSAPTSGNIADDSWTMTVAKRLKGL
ncbi:hypothetical protein CBQ26_12175 [Deinococcus indicus]|uniref:Uncharacterized protein n=1 Tax=Deinococcus indicus TaxID=223556 RepID=A0A246BJL4_9DEIO|nr:hypothetical protein [Deinococcus indicus]OWL95507.1 hypothetical protein CBQ26_12175 [Deinococcus indicus]